MADDNHEGTDLSRRKFIKNTGMVAGGVVGGSLLGGFLTSQFQDDSDTQTKNKETNQQQHLQEARMFFSRKEDFEILGAATERILPKDDNGPGAIELGVPYFIDKQLAGSWGSNTQAYMRDPFYHNKQTEKYQHMDTDQDKAGPNTEGQTPTPIARYQSRLNRGDIVIQGLRKMDKISNNKFNTKFTELEGDKQDKVLQAFDNGEVDLNGVAGVTFFNLLRRLTLEGAYADPLYGGNRNMMGWKMKEYPGPRMGYVNKIKNEEFIELEPKSLRAYQT